MLSKIMKPKSIAVIGASTKEVIELTGLDPVKVPMKI